MGTKQIYSTTELAELAFKHDEAYPGHGSGCACENGVISAFRTYHGPSNPVGNAVVPYVPPQMRLTKPINIDRKSWQAQRDDESFAHHVFRVSHSCYNCGNFFVDLAMLDQHEDNCSTQGKRSDHGSTSGVPALPAMAEPERAPGREHDP